MADASRFAVANDQSGVRRFIAAEIERLIALLDAMGPDPDLEDGADAEPWLGWRDEPGKGCPPDWVYRNAADCGAPMQDDDREQEDEHGGDVVDEPHDDIGEAEPDDVDQSGFGWAAE